MSDFLSDPLSTSVLWVRTTKALARLRGCAGSPEPSLVVYAISTIIPWAASNDSVEILFRCNIHRKTLQWRLRRYFDILADFIENIIKDVLQLCIAISLRKRQFSKVNKCIQTSTNIMKRSLHISSLYLLISFFHLCVFLRRKLWLNTCTDCVPPFRWILRI